MTGNVTEWVNDWYGEYYSSVSPASNPPGPAAGTAKVMRGGGFVDSSDALLLVFRDDSLPAHHEGFIGFRCAAAPRP